jgi:hypothetical protein
MATDDLEYEYDPGRALWRPGRRTFLFMFGAAVAGTILKPTLAQVQAVAGPPGRPPMVDPRLLFWATITELHGDLTLTRELGLEPFGQCGLRARTIDLKEPF